MNSYLVTLADPAALREAQSLARSLDADILTLLNPQHVQLIRVQSECPHGMQEYVDSLTDLRLTHPVVVDIRQESLRRLSLVDPT